MTASTVVLHRLRRRRLRPGHHALGLTDEAGKVNLNTAPDETLLTLPNMTPELVDCLMDYRDSGIDPRPEGEDYYDTLQHPYVIAGQPLATLEELLMVKGFNARIIYGEDANRNGLLEPNEDDGDDSFPPDNRDGQLDRGLKGVATVVTSEPNTSATGKARANINGDVSASCDPASPPRPSSSSLSTGAKATPSSIRANCSR